MFKKMHEKHYTLNGTVVVDGIEYNQYPLINTLVKATESVWAVKLRDEGILRLSSIEYYQRLESSELGDRNDSKGLFHLNGNEMSTESNNEVFVWCAALPETSHTVLKELDQNYDAIIKINNVRDFVRRISNALRNNGLITSSHIGLVKYNRGKEVTKEELKSQRWHFNVFQKNKKYIHQNEFRLAFTNNSFRKINMDHIDLSLGDCTDIAQFNLFQNN